MTDEFTLERSPVELKIVRHLVDSVIQLFDVIDAPSHIRTDVVMTLFMHHLLEMRRVDEASALKNIDVAIETLQRCRAAKDAAEMDLVMSMTENVIIKGTPQ